MASPTPCDGDCKSACHEDHRPAWKRHHAPMDCQTAEKLQVEAAVPGGGSPVRRLHLERSEDISGVSGTGRVAYGAEFPDGTVVLRWDTAVSSTTIYKNVEDLEHIVGHGGRTRVVFDD